MVLGLEVSIPDQNFNPKFFKESVYAFFEGNFTVETVLLIANAAREQWIETNSHADTSTANLALSKMKFEEFLRRHAVRLDPSYKCAFSALQKSCRESGQQVRELTQMRDKLFIVWKVATEIALLCPEEEHDDYHEIRTGLYGPDPI